MNYFAHQTVAERYAQGRPYFHPLVLDRIRSFLQLNGPIPSAVDVACGTGLSALALAEIAAAVTAADISPDMLAQAPPHERIRYVEAPAENLPLATASADLMTVSLAFHWLNRTLFLQEARRVLRPGGALVIYSNNFYGRMHENPEFTRWNRESYLTRYPTPPRHDEPFTNHDGREHHLEFALREHYTNDMAFSPERLAGYLVTQSNVIAAVEQGRETLSSVQTWLLDSLTPLFPSPTATFVFGGEIWILKSIA